MNEDFKKANESLPAEEKEQLQKYQKKGITKNNSISRPTIWRNFIY